MRDFSFQEKQSMSILIIVVVAMANKVQNLFSLVTHQLKFHGLRDGAICPSYETSLFPCQHERLLFLDCLIEFASD